MSRVNLLGKGSYGCVYDQKLKCDMADPNANIINNLPREQNYVSRITSFDDYIKYDLSVFDITSNDPNKIYEKYLLLPENKCVLNSEDIMSRDALSKCTIPRISMLVNSYPSTKNKILNVVSKHGGIDLINFTSLPPDNEHYIFVKEVFNYIIHESCLMSLKSIYYS